MTSVAESAREVGMAAAGGVPVTLMAKLPLEFKTLGKATHAAFDDLANEATDMGDEKVAMTMLGEILGNCNTCHAGDRIELGGDKRR